MADARKERYRRIRGSILKLLAQEHPGPIDTKVLQFLLDDLGYPTTEEELFSHVVYLEDKGCVKRENRESRTARITMVLITAQGLDVLDGFAKPDCGVDVRF